MDYINRLLNRSTSNRPKSPLPVEESGNDGSSPKTAEHEVKVRFAREFADVKCSPRDCHSTSSSLAYFSPSTLDKSYKNPDIPEIDDIIVACRNIRLDDSKLDDETFLSATEGSPVNEDLEEEQTKLNVTQNIKDSPESADPVHSHQIQPIVESCESVTDTTQIIVDECVSNLHETRVVRDPSNLEINRLDQEVDRSELTLDHFRSASDYSHQAHSEAENEQTLNEKSSPVEACVTNSQNSVEDFESSISLKVTESVKEISSTKEDSNDANSRFVTCNLTNDLEDHSLTSAVENIHVDLTEDRTDAKIEKPHEDIVKIVERTSSPETSLDKILNIPSTLTLSETIDFPSSLLSISNITFEEKDTVNSTDNLTTNVKSVLSRSSSPTNDISQEAISSLCNVINSPTTKEENYKFNQVEQLPSVDICSATNNVEDTTDDLYKTATVEPKLTSVENCTERDNFAEDLNVTNDVNISTENQISPKVDNNVVSNVPLVDEIEVLQEEEKINIEALANDHKGDIIDEIEPIDIIEQGHSSEENLNDTLTLADTSINLESEVEKYTEFKPQRQSTTLTLVNDQRCFEEFKQAAEAIANDIKSAAEEESEQFCTATSEIFQDPACFDFLLAQSSSKIANRLRAESLYVKFDPLVSNTSMLPQGNNQSMSEEQNGKNDLPLPRHVGTPKQNPALAALDRLISYSPHPSGTECKTEEPQEKKEQPVQESKPDAAPSININISKELELVRATVLQLEEELERRKKEHEAELEKQKSAFTEKLNKLQAQLSQEIKNKNQMTVVIEEYEKSISRLVAERERDRTNSEQEKAKLQEELQAANHHLTNTEAAFNDVHLKYERLKGVVSAYKSNESVLKESIDENAEIIKTLEARYEQLKNHAMSQLEKANSDLDVMRKQHAAETVKLQAMIKKAELKSNSLAEQVEQKTKENKELTQILDEVIARVGRQNVE